MFFLERDTSIGYAIWWLSCVEYLLNPPEHCNAAYLSAEMSYMKSSLRSAKPQRER